MSHKKKKFSKENSVKFLLLHGNEGATNADGEILQNVLVPVSKTHKPGSSLLLSNLAKCITPFTEDHSAEPNLNKIMEDFDDSDLDESETVESRMKTMCIQHPNRFVPTTNLISDNSDDEEYEDAYSDFSNQFSDASDENSDDLSNPYPLTSVKTDCPENVKTFNERFEKMLEEYDDDQIGALDDEEICGHLSAECERVQNLIDENFSKGEEVVELGNCDESLKEKILSYVDESEDEKYVEIVTEKPLEFDCESILSTYSNIYNRPTVIKTESKIRKIKIPDNPLKKRLTKSDLKLLDEEDSSEEESDDNQSVATSSNIRLKGETPEQRKERKKLVKEAKRECRIMKKENKLIFKLEKKLLKSQVINSQRNAGIKLL